ncbi:MAG TPA: hypothetical protein VMT10_06315 [Solirubrobacteraceae bacterium]|nr:hypothetical protein [Solirubrobacteraceae bacterium]
MTLRRLKLAEWAALVGALGLFASLFLDWYTPARGHAGSGWNTLGWLTLTLLVITILAAVALAAAFIASPVDAFNTPPGVLLAAVGVPALVVLLIDLLTPPWPSASLAAAGWAGAVLAVLMVAGGLASLRDERTSGFGRHATPPPAQPAPPPR